MDIDSTSHRAPFLRTKSNEEFIRTNDLDLRRQEDSLKYVTYLLEKAVGNLRIPNDSKLQSLFLDNCLEYRLDRRTTTYNFDNIDNVKLLLAVSGAGKTRMLLELLYSNFGYYFTAKSSIADFGSADLYQCQVYCDNQPGDVKRAIHLLYFVRAAVCNYLMEKGFKKPWEILLAQLHPVAFFEVDIFECVFTTLLQEQVSVKTATVKAFPLTAIDEIQLCVESKSIHLLQGSTNERPFFSPLVHHSKHLNIFPHFLLSGTGINFEYIKEAMESGTMKRNLVTAYKVVSDFHPLSRSQIESYAAQFLEEHKVTEADEIVSRISAFELCHGRPRFVAYILDGYMESKDIDLSIGEFISGITNVDGQIFPLRFFLRDLKNNKILLNRIISGSTLGDIIRNGLLSLVLKGKLLLTVPDEVGAAAIRYGLGFGGVTEGMLRNVEINELAVMECLRFFVPFSDLVMNFAKQMSACPRPQMVGYLLEYLVAFALVASFSKDDDTLSRITVSQKFCHEYLQYDDASQVCFPDHMCGPDVIYKCVNTKTVYIVQIKFVNTLSKQEIANACNTTEYTKFYCKRKLKEGESGDIILEGFKQKRTQLLEALLNVQREGYSLQQYLFIHTGGKTSNYTRGITIINSSSHPRFFDKIGSGVWEFLNSLRDNF
jgi:hypothetical protein